MRAPWLLALALGGATSATAQTFARPGADPADSTALQAGMATLAAQVGAAYTKDEDRVSFLDNRFRLEIVAAQYDDAAESLAALRALRATRQGPGATAQSPGTDLQYQIYVSARRLQIAGRRSFAESFWEAFRETFTGLDDRTSALVARAFTANLSAMEARLGELMDPPKGKARITLADALALVRAYQIEESYRIMGAQAMALVAEDDRRRYDIAKDVRIRTPDGAVVCALVVRPRAASARLPALLEFTIYADSIAMLNEARRTASNGYVGVEALTRGKGCSPGQPLPYEHDGADAAAVIDWISRQPWSDGRVGTFGGSYNGFTQWAAAKHHPKALKAMMPSVAVAPGVDIPMEGNVFLNFVYYWPFYASTGPWLDDAALNDRARWGRLNRDWYVSGSAYRALDSIEGPPNPIFRRWLEHPSYDAYWRSMIPYGIEFADIDVPVLTTTGYFDGAQLGALYYLTQHYRYRPGARHYLVVGPYDHVRGQRGTTTPLGDEVDAVNGYVLDSVAHIDIGELRYQWFDHVLKRAPRPAILKDRINYEVMGANRWKHAPSLGRMSTRTLRFHLSAAREGDRYRLSTRMPARGAGIDQTLDLADRRDVDRVSPSVGAVDRHLDTWNSVAFISDPLRQPIELSGLFSGRLDCVVNRRDLDFSIGLFELTPQGDYVALSWYVARASYIGDRSHRHLLRPGHLQQLRFRNGRLTSRQFQAGSRLVVVLTLLRQPDVQINYGTGGSVSDETIADARVPVSIRWRGSSFVEVPVSYPTP